jgi:hypothetical protein
VVLTAEPADVFAQASSFVRSYAASTPQWLIAHWARPICVRVVGLTPDQAAAVKARVEAVAKAAEVGLHPSLSLGAFFSAPAGCRKSNVEIGFTTDPQRMLDDVVARDRWLLEDETSGASPARTVTHPIQAWYMTYSARDRVCGGICASPDAQPRGLDNVMVIVDLRRTGTIRLGLISDYVAMLALSQPRSLDRCNVLPSVTDLFACPGRGAPDGLTRADAAFLKALYENNTEFSAEGEPSVIGERMAHILATTKLAAR